MEGRARRPKSPGRPEAPKGYVGRGDYDEATGLYEWYEEVHSGIGWGSILAHWGLIEADLHDVYGIDVEDGILDRRSWRWLEQRIAGLMASRSVAPSGDLVPTTRIGWALRPPSVQS